MSCGLGHMIRSHIVQVGFPDKRINLIQPTDSTQCQISTLFPNLGCVCLAAFPRDPVSTNQLRVTGRSFTIA